MMEHKLVEKPEMRLIGMAIDTTVQNCRAVVPKLWAQFMEKANDIKGLKGIAHYGFCEPISAEECSFTYVACTEVTPDAEVPEGMVEKKFAAGKYAVFEHKGPFSDFGKTYGAIYDWLPGSGLKQKTSDPWVEVYDSKSTDDEKSVVEIWIAVE